MGTVTQMRPAADSRYGIGSGKIQELSDICKNTGAQLAVFDFELTPSQIRAIEDEMETDVSVIDRSILILDIFAGRASSAEGRLQVELAQLKYTAPRLMGKGKDLSRLGGGIGTRGPGESKLEIDRRRMKTRVLHLEEELRRVEKNRNTIRSARERSGICKCAIVGYTNAGKSTLLNALTNAGVLAEDRLFATLDPTARALTLPDGRTVMLIDTVGLIRRLPHQLVEAFHSTLEEAADADLLLHVCDISSPEADSQIEVTRRLLDELGCAQTPTVTILNKCDRLENLPASPGGGRVFVSAKTGYGLDRLLEAVAQTLPQSQLRMRLLLPYDKVALAAKIRENGRIFSEEYVPDGLLIDALADRQITWELKPYLTDG